jgi:hypothetical protein
VVYQKNNYYRYIHNTIYMATDYSITSTADVFSTTSPGQVNLFDTAGTFSVQLQAPSSTVTPYTLTLPSTLGVTNTFSQITDASGTLGWAPNSIVANTSFPYVGRYYSASGTRCTTTSAVNVSADNLIFVGTNALGSNPTAIIVLLGCSNLTTTMVVTVQDITNALTVASLTVSSATFTAINTPNSRNMGALSNFSTGASVWQVTIRRTVGTGTLQFYGSTIVG